MTWRPLLEGERAARAEELVARVAEQQAARAEHPSLFHGSTGRALFFAYLGDTERLEGHLDDALAVAGAIDEGTLVDGMAGLAWTMAHLGQDVEGQVDEALGSLVGAEQPYELLYGVAGIGVYALEGMPRTRPLLERIVASLASGKGHRDLGVAHGVGAAIAVAGAAAGWSVTDAAERYRELRDDAWARTLDAPEGRFPSFHGSDKLSRAAWCYGDPGMAAALLAGARAAGDEEGARRAIALAKLSSKRRDPGSTGADEPSFCHGWIGLAHVYNRLAQASADAELAAVALHWYDRALAAPLPEKTDFLEGTMGIGLGLLAGLRSDEPRWDRLLCVSVRGADEAS